MNKLLTTTAAAIVASFLSTNDAEAQGNCPPTRDTGIPSGGCNGGGTPPSTPTTGNTTNSNAASAQAAAAAEAAAAAQAQATNNNLVVITPTTTSQGGQGGNASATGGQSVATANGQVTTRVANNTNFNQEAQAATPGSIVIAPTSQCGEGFGFAAGVVGGSLSTSRTVVNFRCVDTGAALVLFQSGNVDEKAVALRTLGNLSPAFDAALTSVSSTIINCSQMRMATDSSVMTAAGHCNVQRFGVGQPRIGD